MACECIKEWNEKLKEKFNETATVDLSFFTDGTVRVNVQAIYHKRKSDGSLAKKFDEIKLLPTYCPFCGKKYIEEEGGEK